MDNRPAINGLEDRPLNIHRPRVNQVNGYQSSSSPERASGYHSDFMESSASIPSSHTSKSSTMSASNVAASRSYKEAANFFLTRQMADALAVLRPALRDAASQSTQRATRVKVWSLYFAIFDAAVKMSPEEGKRIWGGQDWRRIVGRVRNGLIWDEVEDAYKGEGPIDTDVVIALVMLVLAHGNDQKTTQKHIEAALAELPSASDSPKALAQRTKLMELYILHVLPRVDEWDYAREFCQMSPFLDADKKENFLTALEALQKEKAEQEARRLEEERMAAEAAEREAKLAEERLRESASASENRSRSTVRKGDNKSQSGTMRSRKRSTARSTASSDYRPASRRSRSQRPYQDDSDDALSTVSGAPRRARNIFSQTTNFAGTLVKYVNHSVGAQKTIQAAVFIFALVWALAKKSARSRLWRYLMFAWMKTMTTIGMGMKVTYV
ncbi:hypothetical protein TWF506_005134 [Arthrobotrys conoides]|uniref:Peroxin 26 n=1 Tax=Arthrobotrys conoides TaxID=74498 RepID=A0AAN8P5Y5_9PEZI